MRKALFKIREKMRRREFILGTNTTFNDACVTELLGDCGFDFIWIDMEHTTITKDSAVQHLIACRASGAASFVRIPWNDPVLAKPILDMGAEGIIIPQIRSYDEAVAAVAAMKYPPKGVRGWAPVRASDYGLDTQAYMTEYGDDRTLCLPQIEHIGAVRDIERICTIEGIDALVIGPMDLSASLGKLGQIHDPEVEAAIERVCTAAREKDVPVCIAAGFDPPFVRKLISLGVTIFCSTGDAGFIQTGARAHISAAQELFAEAGGAK